MKYTGNTIRGEFSNDITNVVILPLGTHTINPSNLDETVTIVVDENAFIRIKQHWDINYQPGDVWVDNNHKEEAAWGWVQDINWNPITGIEALVEWTQEAADRITDKTYKFVSPNFEFNGNEILSLGNPAFSLTNNPAFLALKSEPVQAEENKNNIMENNQNKKVLDFLAKAEKACEKYIAKMELAGEAAGHFKSGYLTAAKCYAEDLPVDKMPDESPEHEAKETPEEEREEQRTGKEIQKEEEENDEEAEAAVRSNVSAENAEVKTDGVVEVKAEEKVEITPVQAEAAPEPEVSEFTKMTEILKGLVDKVTAIEKTQTDMIKNIKTIRAENRVKLLSKIVQAEGNKDLVDNSDGYNPDDLLNKAKEIATTERCDFKTAWSKAKLTVKI